MTAFDALSRIQQDLAQFEADSLLRARMVLESAQGARVKVNGRELVSFCSNDYLGLASPAAARSGNR